jgi:riboflavin synthase
VFSGIVKGIGQVARVDEHGEDRRLTLDTSGAGLGPIELGASVAVNGVCLTAVETAPARFSADVSKETLTVTTLAALAPGVKVNLEPSLRVGDAIDGHWVSGHVDGIGRVVDLSRAARSTVLTIELPEGLGRYVARKGSIAVDGVSLTVNTVAGRRFEVNIVPHTREATIIGEYKTGTAVNIEVDIVARYVERLLGAASTDPEIANSGITLGTLEEHGYANRR